MSKRDVNDVGESHRYAGHLELEVDRIGSTDS